MLWSCFSTVNTIRADVLTQLSSITAVTNSGQPFHGRTLQLHVLPLAEEGSCSGTAARASYPAVEPSRPVLMVEHCVREGSADGVCEGTLSPTMTTAQSTTNQHLGNFGEGGHP